MDPLRAALKTICMEVFQEAQGRLEDGLGDLRNRCDEAEKMLDQKASIEQVSKVETALAEYSGGMDGRMQAVDKQFVDLNFGIQTVAASLDQKASVLDVMKIQSSVDQHTIDMKEDISSFAEMIGNKIYDEFQPLRYHVDDQVQSLKDGIELVQHDCDQKASLGEIQIVNQQLQTVNQQLQTVNNQFSGLATTTATQFEALTGSLADKWEAAENSFHAINGELAQKATITLLESSLEVASHEVASLNARVETQIQSVDHQIQIVSTQSSDLAATIEAQLEAITSSLAEKSESTEHGFQVINGELAQRVTSTMLESSLGPLSRDVASLSASVETQIHSVDQQFQSVSTQFSGLSATIEAQIEAVTSSLAEKMECAEKSFQLINDDLAQKLTSTTLESSLEPISHDIASVTARVETLNDEIAKIDGIVKTAQDANKESVELLDSSVATVRAEVQDVLKDVKNSMENMKSSMEDVVYKHELGEAVQHVQQRIGEISTSLDSKASVKHLEEVKEEQQVKLTFLEKTFQSLNDETLDKVTKDMLGPVTCDVVAIKAETTACIDSLSRLEAMVKTVQGLTEEKVSTAMLDRSVATVRAEIEDVFAVVNDVRGSIEEKVSAERFDERVRGVRMQIDLVNSALDEKAPLKQMEDLKAKQEACAEKCHNLESNFSRQAEEMDSRMHIFTERSNATCSQLEAVSHSLGEQMDSLKAKVDAAHSALEVAVSNEMLEAALSPVSIDITTIKSDMITFGTKATDIEDLLENIQDAVEEKVSMQTLQHSVGDVRAELGEISAFLARTNDLVDEKISERELGAAVEGVHHELDSVKRSLTEKASQKQLDEAISEIQIDAEERLENSDMIVELQSVRQELEEMRAQWMRLGGHMNPQQRIQHVADVKMENNQLRDELMFTRKQLEASGRQLRRHSVIGNVEESLRHSPHTSPKRGRHVRGGC